MTTEGQAGASPVRLRRARRARIDFATPMLLGLPISAAGALGDSSQKMRTTYYGGYVQDDWRITQSLNLNFGLRYEYDPWLKGYRGQVATFDPKQATKHVDRIFERVGL